MALLQNDLSLWEIAFRWEGLDPSRLWLRLPLGARDHFRNLMGGILTGELDCITLSLEKWTPSSDSDAEFYIRSYIDQVYECIAGTRFNRRLLRWALIERESLGLWCERRGIKPPAFWFPEGEKPFPWDDLHKERERRNALRGLAERQAKARGSPDAVDRQISAIDAEIDVLLAEGESRADAADATEGSIIRDNQRARIACQQVAASMWKRNPELRIAELVKDDIILGLCGGSHYNEETIRTWVSGVAPAHVKARRGRPRKEKPL